MCMCDVGPSWCRKEASVELRRSRWRCGISGRLRRGRRGLFGPIFSNSRPTLPQVGSMPEKLLLAAPRGYCAGVDRAVQTVERALELYGAPVYVRKEIVHNKYVVEQLSRRGAVFVESESDAPEGATVVFSAHGVSPSVHENARV